MFEYIEGLLDYVSNSDALKSFASFFVVIFIIILVLCSKAENGKEPKIKYKNSGSEDDGITDETLFFLSQTDPKAFEMAMISRINGKGKYNGDGISDEALFVLSKTNPELFKACMYSGLDKKR